MIKRAQNIEFKSRQAINNHVSVAVHFQRILHSPAYKPNSLPGPNES